MAPRLALRSDDPQRRGRQGAGDGAAQLAHQPRTPARLDNDDGEPARPGVGSGPAARPGPGSGGRPGPGAAARFGEPARAGPGVLAPRNLRFPDSYNWP